MDRNVQIVVLVVLMGAVIVGLDVAFLRHRFWIRLIVNIAVVAAFAAVYWRYLKGP